MALRALLLSTKKGAGRAQCPTRGTGFPGKGGRAYQIVRRYSVPWGEKAAATATVKNHLHKAANMVMVDLGIPPGFDLLNEDLQAYLEKSRSRASGKMVKLSRHTRFYTSTRSGGPSIRYARGLSSRGYMSTMTRQ
jgi:hypothetical protein